MTFRAVGPVRRPVDVSSHERAVPRLRWCDAPVAYGPPKTLYNRWKRWRDMGLFARIMMGLAEQARTIRLFLLMPHTSKHIVRRRTYD